MWALAARGEVESAPGAEAPLAAVKDLVFVPISEKGKAEKAVRVTNDRLELREHLNAIRRARCARPPAIADAVTGMTASVAGWVRYPHLGRLMTAKEFERIAWRNPLISMKTFLFGGRDAARA